MIISQDDPRLRRYREQVARVDGSMSSLTAAATDLVPPTAPKQRSEAVAAMKVAAAAHLTRADITSLEGTLQDLKSLVAERELAAGRPSPFVAPPAWTEHHVEIGVGVNGYLEARPRPEYSLCPECRGDEWVSHRGTSASAYNVTRPCPTCSPLTARVAAYNAALFPADAGHRGQFAWPLVAKSVVRPLGFADDTFTASGKRRRLSLTRYLDTWIAEWRPCTRGIIFAGACGVGKTRLATDLAKLVVLRRGATALWASWPTTLKRIRETYSGQRSSDNPRSILQPLSDTQVLVLDEIGTQETTSQDAVGHLQALLDERFRHGRTTLITTNLEAGNGGVSELDTVLNSRIADRIRGACDLVEVIGESYRTLQARGRVPT